MTGPVIDGRRAVHGGWYLPPKVEDAPAYRYGCFGTATPAALLRQGRGGRRGEPRSGRTGRESAPADRAQPRPRKPAGERGGRRAGGAHDRRPRAATLPAWWPLAALTLLAAALRLSTLGLQSFWYDEAFTPVHVLHASLGATLRSVVHTENTPPLWYVLALGVVARLRHRRGRAAPALGARSASRPCLSPGRSDAS